MSQAALDQAIAEVTRSVPRFITESGAHYKYSYGTAGFRDVADRLPSAMVRVGILAALESKSFGGKPVGVVITASHNQGSDNGAKIMDCHGEMMAHSWEDFAGELANASEGEDVAKLVKEFAAKETIDLSSPSIVFVGRDTRKSSPMLRDCVVKGVLAMGGKVYDHGQVTTPQLHWIVRSYNQNPSLFEPLTGVDRNHLKHYNQNIADAVAELLDGPVPTLTVDCANGIGAVAFKNLQPYISKYVPTVTLNTAIENHAKLNNKVGAEHVQKTQQLPEGVNPDMDVLKKFASIDGDADRVVYFYVDANKKFCLLDGDKIIALVGTYLQKLIKEANLNLRIGVVQTAYANGAATNYLQTVIGVPVACVPTGVKFLHHKATEYDIGIYFEANGHGTVLFSPESISKISAVAADKKNPAAVKAASRLLALTKLINQAVGDAISDIMLIEVVLSSLNMDLEEWNKFYADLPSCQSKVKVKDRTVVVTTDAERRVSSPASLQASIDEAVKKFKCGRAFVRPSGTEDVIRTYAEAATEADAKTLSDLVVKAVYEHAGGI